MFRIFSKVSPADLLTMANAVCGVIASTYFIQGRGGDVGAITIGCCLLLICMIFDGLDGIVARKFGSKHAYGTHLDSIADMLSFCWAPGILIYCAYFTEGLDRSTAFLVYAATAFAVVFGMWRLVVFIKEGHKYKNFFGIPTPANCLFVMTTCYFYVNYKAGNLEGIPIIATAAHLFSDTPQGLVLIMAVSLFMVSSFVYIKISGNLAKVLGVIILILFISFILNAQHVPLYYLPQFIMWVLIWGYVMFCPIRDMLDTSDNGWLKRTRANQMRRKEARRRKREERRRRREEWHRSGIRNGWFLKPRHHEERGPYDDEEADRTNHDDLEEGVDLEGNGDGGKGGGGHGPKDDGPRRQTRKRKRDREDEHRRVM